MKVFDIKPKKLAVTKSSNKLPLGFGRIILVAVVVGVLSSAIAALSWSNPTVAPPGGNVSESLNVSSTSQTKSGALTIATSTYLATTGGRVGIGTASPNVSAILDLTSTSGGFLLPRMTSTQRDAIASPATGLLVYNTTDNKINRWDGAAWGEVGGVGWAANGNDIYNSNSGSVGIGTGATTLNALLDITGSLKIGNTAATCDSSKAGVFRWTGTNMDFCNGFAWRTLSGVKTGAAQTAPGDSCKQIKNDGYSAGDGLYWIDPDGGSTSNAYQVYCDMTTNGGGWVLVMQIVIGQNTSMGYQTGASYWTQNTTLNDTPPTVLSSTNAKYSTFNSFVTTDGYLMLKDKTTGNYTTLSVPSMAGTTLLNRFITLGGGAASNSPGTPLTFVSGMQSPQELMGYSAPTAMCASNPSKWRMNFQNSHAGARLGNDVATNDSVTNSASSWPCYNGEGSNLSYSGAGGTLESGDQWQDSYGSESLDRYRSGGFGPGSHKGVSIFVR